MKQIKLHTEIPIEPSEFKIGHSDSLFLLGSCFTENMGKRLADLEFRTMLNPFGILYNPLSMALALSYCLDDKRVGEEDLVFRDELWHSWLHHGSFSRRDKQACLDACNSAISDAHSFLQSCNTIIITYGSAWYYQLKPNSQLSTPDAQPSTLNFQFSIFNSQFSSVVANCHKVPSTFFDKRLATVDEVVAAWQPLAERIIEKGIRLIFTISPVRHQAYGAHGNQLGKAVLLLSIDKILSHFSNHQSLITYFPSYEIVVDELRDYRFYSDDMAHPSPMAEEIVWQRFQQTFMTQSTIDRCDEIDKCNRRSAHRPLHQ